MAPLRLIIDTDPGVDDCLAIFLAFNNPNVEVRAARLMWERSS